MLFGAVLRLLGVVETYTEIGLYSGRLGIGTGNCYKSKVARGVKRESIADEHRALGKRIPYKISFKAWRLRAKLLFKEL